MLTVDGIRSFYGEREILQDISFALRPGELVSVLGINGSGKSTLLKTISGFIQPRFGRVLIDDTPVSGMTGSERAKKIGYMPQKANGISCTIFDAVLLGRKPHINWKASAHDLQVVEHTLRMLGMEHYALRSTLELSGGEFQKVAIARALVQEPRILLLDEPINHLDIRNQLEIMTMLREITHHLNLITVTVLHDLSAALRFSDRFVLLKGGGLYAFGDKNVITAEAVKTVFGVEAHICAMDAIPMVVPISACA